MEKQLIRKLYALKSVVDALSDELEKMLREYGEDKAAIWADRTIKALLDNVEFAEKQDKA